MRSRIACIAVLGLFALPQPQARAREQAAAADRPLLFGVTDGASLTNAVQGHLNRAADNLARVQSQGLDGTEVLRLFDGARLDIEAADSLSSFIARVSSDAAVRNAAEHAAERVSVFANQLAVNRQVFEALGRINPDVLDPEGRVFLTRTLATYRAAGVGLDGPQRDRVSRLRTTIDDLNRQFTSNIENGTRKLRVPASELAGLPDDFLKRHPPAPDGMIELTTAAADAGPTLANASSAKLRREMFIEVQNVGYPQNAAVLSDLRVKRFELATQLGYRSWAEYDTSDRMAASSREVEAFLRAVDEGTRAQAKTEYGLLLRQERLADSNAKVVAAWDADFYTEKVRRRLTPDTGTYQLPYDTVASGILRVAAQLFDLSFVPVTVPVWDPSVRVMEIQEHGRPLGRVYFDMYVRPNKRNRGASTVALRSGHDNQLPEVALIAGFGGASGQPSVLSLAEIRTYFHEFGHVLHFVLGGRHRWSGLDAIHAERDFLEAPSQMLEAWMWSPQALAVLAGSSGGLDTLALAQLRGALRAAQFGEALRERNLLFRARLAFALHGADATVSADTLTRDLYASSLPYPYVPETHHYAGFTHLANPNYTAGYYTYLWSLAVAKDLESAFDHEDLMASGPARRYRETVLEAGAALPARQIIRRFLGRDFSTAAWREFVRHEYRLP